MISYEEFTKKKTNCQQKFKNILGYTIASTYLYYMKVDKVNVRVFDYEFINKFLYDSLVEIQNQNITRDLDWWKLNNKLVQIYLSMVQKYNLTDYVENIQNLKNDERQKRELDRKFAKVLDMIHKLDELNVLDGNEILKNINKEELEKLLESECDL